MVRETGVRGGQAEGLRPRAVGLSTARQRGEARRSTTCRHPLHSPRGLCSQRPLHGRQPCGAHSASSQPAGFFAKNQSRVRERCRQASGVRRGPAGRLVVQRGRGGERDTRRARRAAWRVARLLRAARCSAPSARRRCGPGHAPSTVSGPASPSRPCRRDRSVVWGGRRTHLQQWRPAGFPSLPAGRRESPGGGGSRVGGAQALTAPPPAAGCPRLRRGPTGQRAAVCCVRSASRRARENPFRPPACAAAHWPEQPRRRPRPAPVRGWGRTAAEPARGSILASGPAPSRPVPCEGARSPWGAGPTSPLVRRRPCAPSLAQPWPLQLEPLLPSMSTRLGVGRARLLRGPSLLPRQTFLAPLRCTGRCARPDK